MLGSGLTVLAFDYGCIREMVRPGENGLLFSTGADLARHLASLLGGYPSGQAWRDRPRPTPGLPVMRWEEGWRAEAWPLFEALGA